MANESGKAPVRKRTRVVDTSLEERLVADPVGPPRKKRLPNSGSMKKGETRNPNGRPKGAKGTKAMIRKELSKKTTIKEGGVSRKATIFQALLLKEAQLAFAGDWRARRTMLELGRWALPETETKEGAAGSTPSRETDESTVGWHEREVLEAFRQARGDDARGADAGNDDAGGNHADAR